MTARAKLAIAAGTVLGTAAVFALTSVLTLVALTRIIALEDDDVFADD